MDRQNIKIPVLIGGATTSKAHTAVKIAPVSQGPVIHVNDASRAVAVVSNLLQKDKKEPYILKIREEYEVFKEKFLERTSSKTYLTYELAQQNALLLDWNQFTPTKPKVQGGITLNNFPLEELVPFIDWSPFFRSWDLHGKYPDILTDNVVGEQAQSLFADAKNMLSQLLKEKWLTAKARFGIFPANSHGDDVEVYANEDRESVQATWLTLRQQLKKTKDQANIALSDFIAPKTTGVADYIGAFCVCTGFGTAERAKAFEEENDDYNSIMIKALADRLAEAFAEYLHLKVRKEYWGYASY